MTIGEILATAVLIGVIFAYLRGEKVGADHAALKDEKSRGDALEKRVEVDHDVKQAAAGGAADLAALARSSGLVRPGDK